METKFKIASQKYNEGYTCSQAVFSAYAEEIGIGEETACRIMEGFGGGMGGMQEICGALSGAFAVISYFSSEGTPERGQKRFENYRKIQKAAEIFKLEYGGITCREVLKGEKPKAAQCSMKVKDAVLIIKQALADVDQSNAR